MSEIDWLSRYPALRDYFREHVGRAKSYEVMLEISSLIKTDDFDHGIANLLSSKFEHEFHLFSLNQLSKLLWLVSQAAPEHTLSLIEDTIKVHLKAGSTIDLESLKLLLKGTITLPSYRAKLFKHVKSALSTYEQYVRVDSDVAVLALQFF